MQGDAGHAQCEGEVRRRTQPLAGELVPATFAGEFVPPSFAGELVPPRLAGEFVPATLAGELVPPRLLAGELVPGTWPKGVLSLMVSTSGGEHTTN